MRLFPKGKHLYLLLYVCDDEDDGEVGGMNGFRRGHRSTRRKPAPMPLCPPQIPLATPGREPGPPRWEASEDPLQLWRSPNTREVAMNTPTQANFHKDGLCVQTDLRRRQREVAKRKRLNIVFVVFILAVKSRNSLIDIATGYGLELESQ
jgi:hypothetical protein